MYIPATLPSSLRNDLDGFPAYNGRMVTERPEKWKWGVVQDDEPRLDPLLRGLEKLRSKGFTAADVVAGFHI